MLARISRIVLPPLILVAALLVYRLAFVSAETERIDHRSDAAETRMIQYIRDLPPEFQPPAVVTQAKILAHREA